MMNVKNTLALALAAAASMPHPAAEAAPARKGVEARISEDSRYGRSRLADRSTFHLDARDPRTEEIVMKAECVVNSRGEVRSLITLPKDAPDAEERSL